VIVALGVQLELLCLQLTKTICLMALCESPSDPSDRFSEHNKFHMV